MIEEETGEARPMVLTDAIEAIECTWMRELDGADKDMPGELNGYEGPYHDWYLQAPLVILAQKF
jgi:hypothetical protein